jgi:hypothetical protein
MMVSSDHTGSCALARFLFIPRRRASFKSCAVRSLHALCGSTEEAGGQECTRRDTTHAFPTSPTGMTSFRASRNPDHCGSFGSSAGRKAIPSRDEDLAVGNCSEESCGHVCDWKVTRESVMTLLWGVQGPRVRDALVILPCNSTGRQASLRIHHLLRFESHLHVTVRGHGVACQDPGPQSWTRMRWRTSIFNFLIDDALTISNPPPWRLPSPGRNERSTRS